MKIHEEEAPARGETLLETHIQSDLCLKTPLTLRIVSQLIADGLIEEEDREKLEICCEEALKNAIVHGNGENPARWVIVRVFRDEEEWGISVEDQGAGFSEEKARESKPSSPLWLEEGRGIQLMEHVMDRVEYFSGGRHLVLSMKIPEKEERTFTSRRECAQAGPLRLSEKSGGLVAHLALPSKDEESVDAVFKSLLDAIDRKDLRVVVVDLSQVGYMTSHAIGRLISLYKTCLRKGMCLRLASVGPDLKKVFLDMHLNTLFAFYDRPEEAVETLTE